MLKQALALGAILSAVAFPLAAIADETGAVGGGVAGAIGGAVVGGPIGAVVGGVGGAVVGGAVTSNRAPYVYRGYGAPEGRAAYIDDGDGYAYVAPAIPNANVPPNSPYAIMPQGR